MDTFTSFFARSWQRITAGLFVVATRGAPRLSGCALAALALAALVGWMAPQQLPVSLYKTSLVTLAGVLGYWGDRFLFPYARPDALLRAAGWCHADWSKAVSLADLERGVTMVVEQDMEAAMLRLAAMAMIRRAVIVAATMLAMGLGA